MERAGLQFISKPNEKKEVILQRWRSGPEGLRERRNVPFGQSAEEANIPKSQKCNGNGGSEIQEDTLRQELKVRD